MGGRQDKGWGWEMRTKSTQSCFGAHPEHKCTNSKTLFFFLPKFIRSHLHPQPSSHEMASRRLLYRKNTNLAGERKGSDPCPG